ncbi:MAG: SCP2 sterol-binding domain-containing protein [Acidiferrobacterales bacterium]
MKSIIVCTLLGLMINVSAVAAPVFMSGEWAVEACKGWNANKDLTEKLKKSGWVENNKGRPHKIMQIYRIECENSPRVELHIADKDGKAMCVYGGWAKNDPADLKKSVDYIMFAKDKNWARMGDGRDGAMKAMMFGRLKFKGPKMEAMGNMGPFGGFLRLTGTVESDRSSCPSK